MQIRKIKTGDKEKLLKLLLEFYDYTQSFLSEKQAQFRKYSDPGKVIEEDIEEYLSPKFITFVAEENGELKGLIVGEVKEKKGRVHNKEGFVDKWYVDESYQRKGVGRELFEKLEEEFKKAGCTHIALDTHLENTTAIQIYKHLGFTKRLVTFLKLLNDPI